MLDLEINIFSRCVNKYYKKLRLSLDENFCKELSSNSWTTKKIRNAW